MNHEAYENQMLDGVNRHAEEKTQHTGTAKTPVAKRLLTKADAQALKQGLKRVLFALITAATFALAVFCFIAVTWSRGYWAVALFLGASFLTIWTITLVYAQGITVNERQGDGK